MSKLKRYMFELEFEIGATDEATTVGTFTTHPEGNWMLANNVDVVLDEYRALMLEASEVLEVFCSDVPAAHGLSELAKRLEVASNE